MRLRQECGNSQQAPPPSGAELLTLAGELEELWRDSGTDIRLKKRIVRTLIEEIE
jgi:hypothetical protein